MWLLQSLLSSNLGAKVQEQALKSVASWADFGLDPELMEPLVEQVFQALHKQDTFDAAVDSLVKIFSHPEMERYPNTLQKLLLHTLRTQEMYEKALAEKDMDELFECEEEEFRKLVPVFQPLYYTLIQVLLAKVQYPEDQEFESWAKDEQEAFRCFRQDIGDTMTVEGIFFMFGSMAECVDLEETVYLPMLMNMVPSIHFTNITLLSTALYMIGSFGEWMNSHPEILSCVLPLVLQGLNNSKVGTAATMALKDITRESLDHIRPFIPQILSTSQTILQKDILLERDAMRLMSCIGQVLSILPIPDIMNYLDAILVPRLQHMQHLVKQEVFVVMQQILPTVQELVAKWKSEPSIVEAVNEMFKKSLSVLMDDFQPLANSVADMMIQMYEKTPHASILDVARQIILLFGSDAAFTQYVNTMLNVICTRTLESYPAVLREPDVVEAFMIFLGNIEFLTAGYEEESIKVIVNNNIQFIVDRVLRAIGGEAARHIMEIISDVLLACCKYHFPVLNTTIRVLLATDGYPSPRASPQDKQNFLKVIISDKNNKRKMRETVKEFSLLCRGLLGTEYVEVAKQFL
nr:hypothetical protein BaRGS_010747 [Batillaria attramentaria]